jgi:CBS domain-containing protein
MPTASDLIRMKSNREIWSVSPEATVFEALQILAAKNVGALLVEYGETVENGENIEGIISERDCVRKVDLQGRSSKETKVREIMTSHVLYIDINQSLEEVMAIMTEKKVRHLPVMANRELAGIISIGDVLKEMISDQKFMIEQLSRYISGAGR